MSIQDRMIKINEIANTCHQVYRRDSFHSVYSCKSVRTGKPYQVILDWSKDNGILTLTGHLFTFDPKEQVDKGNGYHPANDGYHPANDSKTVCYQVLGTIKKMAQDNGKQISFCEDKGRAYLVSQFGGEIIRIRNTSDNGKVWAVVKDKDTLKKNVELMRQPEGYID